MFLSLNKNDFNMISWHCPMDPGESDFFFLSIAVNFWTSCLGLTDQLLLVLHLFSSFSCVLVFSISTFFFLLGLSWVSQGKWYSALLLFQPEHPFLKMYLFYIYFFLKLSSLHSTLGSWLLPWTSDTIIIQFSPVTLRLSWLTVQASLLQHCHIFLRFTFR